MTASSVKYATRWRPYVSYNLWQKFYPAVGKEYTHCDRKRGYEKARKNEPEIDRLLKQDNVYQTIGILAQKGIYEFHQNLELLSSAIGVEQVGSILELDQQLPEIKDRVEQILRNYQENPILVGKDIIKLSRGDEGFPDSIPLKLGYYEFNLFAATDCIYQESDGTIHILDFKTGHSDFDIRQAYVYLLAAQYLYPNQKHSASFYNLETGQQSDRVTASQELLESVKIELANLAKRNKREINNYKSSPTEFDFIYPANPGKNCSYCPFNSICKYSTSINLEVNS